MQNIRVMETRGKGAYEFEIHCEGCRDVKKSLARLQLWEEDTFTMSGGVTELEIFARAGWEDLAADHAMSLAEYIADLRRQYGSNYELMKVHNCAKELVK